MVSPGPDFILVTRSALTLPRRYAMATALGIVAGCLLHASYCVLGLAIVLTQSILLFSLVKYAGAAYLIYIGWQALRSSPTAPVQESHADLVPQSSLTKAFTQGFLCNVLNPKLALFLLSLFTQFISVHAGLVEKAIVASVFVAEAALYWPLLVLVLGSALVREAFERCQRVLDRVCGVLLIGLGLRVALLDE